MTITDQIKILDRKIMQNEAQYDLGRKAAKIPALSSNNLDKCEYLTGEDLGLTSSTIERTKFEYSPSGKIFNKGLSKDDQKEGLFKRLENIEDTNLTQLQAIKDRGEQQLRELKNIEENRALEAIDKFRRKNNEAKDLVFKIKKIHTELDTANLAYTKTDGKTKFDFNLFKSQLKFSRKIHNYEITLDEAIEEKEKLKNSFNQARKLQTKENKKNIREK